MKEQRLNLGYTTISDKLFVPLCQSVIESMTDNSHFPNVGDLLTELTTAFDDYFAAIPPKNIENEVNISAKNVKKEAAKKVMRAMGFYVQMIARDDLEMLISSGFSVAKSRGKVSKELPMPAIETLSTNGTPRQLIVKCKYAVAADLYDVRISTDDVNWNGIGNTNNRSKVKVDNVPADVILYVQVRMRNTEHTTPWSASTTTRIFDTAIAMPLAN